MIDDLDDDVRSYLGAVGAIAVYAAVQNNAVVRLGFGQDPRKALGYMTRHWPNVEFGWLAWFSGHDETATAFMAEINDRERKLIVDRSPTAVKVPRPLVSVVAQVENIARRNRVTLTPHNVAIGRAKAYATRLDLALGSLQNAGHFAAFNRAYRNYREARRLEGESATPFFAVKEQMRQTIIRYLVANKWTDQTAVLDEIRKQFPWFTRHGRPTLAHSKKTPV